MNDRASRGKPRFDVTTVGESLIRLSVQPGERLANARSLDINVAGAESNVCAALAGLGRKCGWLSKLPANSLGQLALRRLREWGVDTSAAVVDAQGRMGTYFVELAEQPLPVTVTYDRAGSAFTELSSGEVDWDYLLDTRRLHLTGITPALGVSASEVVREAVARAMDRGVPVSLDVNFRERLWSANDAARTLRPLVEGVDLLLCSKSDANRVFGLEGDDRHVLESLRKLSGAPHVVMSLGSRGSLANSEGRVLSRDAIPVRVIDRIGAGDAFAAGVIDGLLDGDLEQGLDTGTALAAFALSQHGDVVDAGREDTLALLSTVGPGVLR